MAVEARLKEWNRYPRMVALNGREYVKTEFRAVPSTREEEAKRTNFLEVRVAEALPEAAAVASVTADTGILAGNVGAVTKAVALMEDPGELSDLATEERQGQNRKGVAKAIDARMLEIAEGLDNEDESETEDEPAVDLSILEGNVAAVSEAVAEMSDLEELAALAEGEAGGKMRTGVAKAIEARLAELAE